MTTFHNYLRPSTASSGFKARDVAKAYNFPLQYDGSGYTCGIIELGGAFKQSDLNSYFGELGLPVPNVEAVGVDGGKPVSDGPNGADGEVLLDIEVAAAIAPGAQFKVYFAENTDAGFLAAIKQATSECDVISISWGQSESQWDASSLTSFDAAFKTARQNGVVVFVAAGDSGADDGTGKPNTDFPASSPNVVGCGGTRLDTDANDVRISEVVWDDDDRSSATGGGASKAFPGRNVPDIAGNADPESGYEVLVDGQSFVIGGTSAVAPLYAGLALLLSQAVGQPIGRKVDFLNTLLTNMGVCYDVTSGDNGAYRAGPGRDQVTGFGVVDGNRLLAVLSDPVSDPQPIPSPEPDPTPPSPENPDQQLWDVAGPWTQVRRNRPDLVKLKTALIDWHNKQSQG